MTCFPLGAKTWAKYGRGILLSWKTYVAKGCFPYLIMTRSLCNWNRIRSVATALPVPLPLCNTRLMPMMKDTKVGTRSGFHLVRIVPVWRSRSVNFWQSDRVVLGMQHLINLRWSVHERKNNMFLVSLWGYGRERWLCCCGTGCFKQVNV